jgi:hypothetical protein
VGTDAAKNFMTPLIQGTVSGLIFGGLTVASMLPMKFPDKPAALTAAFLNRFSIGLFIPLLKGPLASPGWLVGLGVGVLLSLPSAIITKAAAPIMIIGAIGGAVIGAFA